MKKKYPYTSNELKIRKQWLITMIITYFSNMASTYNTFPLDTFEKGLSFAFVLLFFSFASFMHYYCAYRYPGIKLLTFGLIINFPILVAGVFGLFANLPLINAIGFSVLVLSYAAWYYIICIKLRGLNKIVKSEFIKAQIFNELTFEIAQTKTITNLNDLKNKVDALIHKSPQLQPLIYEAFENKRKELSLINIDF